MPRTGEAYPFQVSSEGLLSTAQGALPARASPKDAPGLGEARGERGGGPSAAEFSTQRPSLCALSTLSTPTESLLLLPKEENES